MGIDVKIIVNRAAAMGDVLFTTPVVRRLRRTYPDAKIYIQTQHPHTYFGNEDINGINRIDITPDLFIDLDMSYETRPTLHQLDAYMLEAFGDTGDGHDRSVVFRIAEGNIDNDNYVVVHPHVAWENRTLSRQWWGDLTQRLSKDYTVVSTGTALDHDLSDFGAIDTRGRYSLAQQALIMAKSRAVICGGGIIVLAQVTDAPVICFGTISRKEHYMAHRHGELGWNTTVIMSPVPCVSCREHEPPNTFFKCRYGTNACVSAFDVDEVYGTVINAINNDRRKQ